VAEVAATVANVRPFTSRYLLFSINHSATEVPPMSTASNPLPYGTITTDRRDMFAAFAMLGHVLQGETDPRKIAEASTILADTLAHTLDDTRLTVA
jgi:hypothetical protein